MRFGYYTVEISALGFKGFEEVEFDGRKLKLGAFA